MTGEKYIRKKSLYKRLKESKKIRATSTVILPIALGAVIAVFWQKEILHKLFNTDTFTLPLLTKIVSIVSDNADKIIENSISTIIVAFCGLVFGCLLGYLVAVFATFKPRIGIGALSVVGAFASIPIVALSPVMNNWTKDISSDAEIRSMISKILVVALISAANMCINAYRGLNELEPYALDLMNMYVASGRVVFFKLRFKNSLPYVFVALKVAVPAAIMSAIVSEYFAEYITGVGRQIRENIVLAQYSTAWAYIMAACFIGIVSYIVLMIIKSIVLKNYAKDV